MVHHPARGVVGHAGLDGLDVAVLVQIEIGVDVAEQIRTLRRHQVVRELDDQIGLADLPLGRVREVDRRRHVLGVAPRRAAVDPRGHERDLRIAQRGVVLELLDADVLVDVPGRHLAIDDAVPDRAGPGSDLLVGDQRHRGHLALAMAHLAGALQDRRDVLGERDLGRRGLRRRQRRCGNQRREQRDPRQTLNMLGHTNSPLPGRMHSSTHTFWIKYSTTVAAARQRAGAARVWRAAAGVATVTAANG